MPWLWPAIFALEFLILVVDVFTAVGIAESIFYIVPLALCYFQRSPALPLYAAAVATVLTVVGYVASPEGIVENVALINRAFVLAAIWCVAWLLRQVLITRGEIELRNWFRTAQGELALRARGELTVADLSRRGLAFLCEYLGAQVGALYIRPGKDARLVEAAGYALARAEGAAAGAYRFGEGLVGQVAVDGQVHQVESVPPGYLQVSSGLGRTEAGCLLLAPLTADDRVVGVLELGFLGKPSPWAAELLADVGEQFGSALRSAQYKARLADLLAESQRQAEALQVQQEELASLNEELEQQNRALRESQVRLENQQAELEQTNQELEQQTVSLERQKAVLDERNQALLAAQQRLREQQAELERASRYKSEFLANMSHELRTPLNSSLILARLLAENREGNLTEDQVRFAETIHNAGSDLLNLINDILDLSKVEAGKLEIHSEPFAVDQLLHGLDSVFRPLAEHKGLNLRLERGDDMPAELVSDRQRVEQILRNFLSNAIKFTERGEVVLRLWSEQDSVAMAVTDTGMGIPEDQHAAIFEAFRQADGSTSRKYGGTGLGLTISRELAQLLGGSISVDSRPGEGATFTLRLPRADTREATPPPPVAVPTKAPAAAVPAVETTGARRPTFGFQDDRALLVDGTRRILIVEDDEAFARILLDLAREMRFQALVAPTAGEGLEMARQYGPHAIVLDIRLPDHSGMLLLEQLKSNPATRHIPVQVVSAADFELPARRLGAVGYMLKPVKREQLIAAFQAFEQRIKQQVKRVLVVEDNPTQRDSIVRLIEGDDLRIDAVGSAGEALERLARTTYDCMVLDLALPDRSGYELLAELSKAESAYSYPPVIVYTGRDLSRDEEEQLRRYSSSIIVKGARSPERLLSEITLFLHRVETELPPERQKMLGELRSRERSLDGASVLLVDDDVRNIFALSSALERHGARVEAARNGREALAKLDLRPDVDLVLMDIMMPEMNGYEAMRAIRAQARFERLPIIALTAKAMRDDQEKCLRAGANDYLAKPVDLDKLLSLARVWLSSRKGL